MFEWYQRAYGGWKGRMISALTAMFLILGGVCLFVGCQLPIERRALAFAGTVAHSEPECHQERSRHGRSVERCSLWVTFEDGHQTVFDSHMSAKDLHQYGRPGMRLEKLAGQTDVVVDGVRHPWEYANDARYLFYAGLLLLPIGIALVVWRIRATAT